MQVVVAEAATSAASVQILWQKRLSNRRAFEKVKRKVLEAEYSKG